MWDPRQASSGPASMSPMERRGWESCQCTYWGFGGTHNERKCASNEMIVLKCLEITWRINNKEKRIGDAEEAMETWPFGLCLWKMTLHCQFWVTELESKSPQALGLLPTFHLLICWSLVHFRIHTLILVFLLFTVLYMLWWLILKLTQISKTKQA